MMKVFVTLALTFVLHDNIRGDSRDSNETPIEIPSFCNGETTDLGSLKFFQPPNDVLDHFLSLVKIDAEPLIDFGEVGEIHETLAFFYDGQPRHMHFDAYNPKLTGGAVTISRIAER